MVNQNNQPPQQQPPQAAQPVQQPAPQPASQAPAPQAPMQAVPGQTYNLEALVAAAEQAGQVPPGYVPQESIPNPTGTEGLVPGAPVVPQGYPYGVPVQQPQTETQPPTQAPPQGWVPASAGMADGAAQPVVQQPPAQQPAVQPSQVAPTPAQQQPVPTTQVDPRVVQLETENRRLQSQAVEQARIAQHSQDAQMVDAAITQYAQQLGQQFPNIDPNMANFMAEQQRAAYRQQMDLQRQYEQSLGQERARYEYASRYAQHYGVPVDSLLRFNSAQEMEIGAQQAAEIARLQSMQSQVLQAQTPAQQFQGAVPTQSGQMDNDGFERAFANGDIPMSAENLQRMTTIQGSYG